MKLKGQKKKIPVLILHLGLKMKPLKMAYQNRRLPGAIDVIGQTITISRVEGRRRANENSNIQVLSERCAAEVDNNFSKPPPFFPPGGPPTHLPPPPFLPPPPTVSTAPPLIPPPGDCYWVPGTWYSLL
ncbi:pre-mRNA 3'-end-processing factor FIP1-like isoform X11 [Lepus europaeus]|uniref:pre-mRNA 3'-end-processing factor FIP1-like isoform X11 n=1 Tax=Lepus europaeus TaxID=9983 RepID=UPI002B4771A8|nr:pre-mRNA 3'-end-processing factor FIP1-like isoform X11 [Lepus europaeus]